jgi:hypothetical protein
MNIKIFFHQKININKYKKYFYMMIKMIKYLIIKNKKIKKI